VPASFCGVIEPAGPSRFLVLVVAEDRFFAERCRQYLEATGHRASLAPGWWVGVHLAEAEKPDLVVVDEALADVDGLSVLALLKAHPSTAGLPVVVAVSRERADLRRRAERLGARAIALKAELTTARLLEYLPRPLTVGPAS
jgi:PleD family two-component response regulator